MTDLKCLLSKIVSNKHDRSPIERFGSLIKQRALLGLVCGALFCLFSAARADATNYYVSPNGNNTTGTSYATAFNELNQINWSSIVNPESSYLYIDWWLVRYYVSYSINCSQFS